jgi:hypothetical protein
MKHPHHYEVLAADPTTGEARVVLGICVEHGRCMVNLLIDGQNNVIPPDYALTLAERLIHMAVHALNDETGCGIEEMEPLQ